MLQPQCPCGSRVAAASRRPLRPTCTLQAPPRPPSQQPAAAAAAAVSRRSQLGQLAAGVAGLLGLSSSSGAPAAHASIANDAARGLVSFWKSRQTQNGGIKLLAPLRVAQRRLVEAKEMLDTTASNLQPEAAVPVDEAAVTEVLQRVRASSLNCYTFEAFPDDSLETRASLLTQRFELSDPCTFRIILKNVLNLEPPAVKAEAGQKMDDLVMSYQRLDNFLEMARDGNAEALPRAQQEIRTTMQVAADIENLVISVLGV